MIKKGWIALLTCPPSGEHRYVFKLYALDTFLTLDNGVVKTN